MMRNKRSWIGPCLGGVLLIGVGAWGLRAADTELRNALDRVRPELEMSLSRPLGHPVSIGAYEGLRPWGVSLGPTKILPTASDRSSVSLDGVTVGLDPLASLRQWQPVVQLKLRGLRADLQRNADGSFWKPGRTDGSKSLPKVELRYALEKPARIKFDSFDQPLVVESRGSVQLAEASFSTTSALRWRGQAGRIRLEGSGRWDRPTFSVRTRIERLKLQPLIALARPDQG